MPSRSFFQVPDQLANRALIFEQHSEVNEVAVEKFVARGMPPLLDQGSLAHLIGISSKIVFSIIKKKQNHYRTFDLLKKSGGFRTVSAPRTYLKVIQWWILDNILSDIDHEICVTGFRSGASPYLNAQMHLSANHVLNVDIKNYFPSIKKKTVEKIWRDMGYSVDVSQQLAEITTYHDELPQGAPTSPAIANIAAKGLDKALNGLAEHAGLKYTRYADDITFSGRTFIAASYLDSVREIVQSHGFDLNDRKSRFLGRANRMEVTGFVINERTQLPRKWRKKVRAIFFQADKNPERWVDRLPYLVGLFGAVSMFSEPGESLHDRGMVAIKRVRLEKRRIGGRLGKTVVG